jgi:hypothetical protein
MNNYDFTNMYNKIHYTSSDMGNKILCTFSTLENLDNSINTITNKYSVLYNKMFVLYIKSTNEYAITYNIELANTSHIMSNTILVHRKKEFNVLYSINSLNELIKKLNNGIVDSSYQINWQHYKNSILLTNQGEFKQLNTKIYKIVEL